MRTPCAEAVIVDLRAEVLGSVAAVEEVDMSEITVSTGGGGGGVVAAEECKPFLPPLPTAVPLNCEDAPARVAVSPATLSSVAVCESSSRSLPPSPQLLEAWVALAGGASVVVEPIVRITVERG